VLVAKSILFIDSCHRSSPVSVNLKIMDENLDDSVYNLITNLCEKFSNDQSKIRKLRSTAYEILLKKRTNNSSTSKLIVSLSTPFNTFLQILKT
jgi:hypothetical protein